MWPLGTFPYEKPKLVRIEVVNKCELNVLNQDREYLAKLSTGQNGLGAEPNPHGFWTLNIGCGAKHSFDEFEEAKKFAEWPEIYVAENWEWPSGKFLLPISG